MAAKQTYRQVPGGGDLNAHKRQTDKQRHTDQTETYRPDRQKPAAMLSRHSDGKQLGEPSAHATDPFLETKHICEVALCWEIMLQEPLQALLRKAAYTTQQ